MRAGAGGCFGAVAGGSSCRCRRWPPFGRGRVGSLAGGLRDGRWVDVDGDGSEHGRVGRQCGKGERRGAAVVGIGGGGAGADELVGG